MYTAKTLPTETSRKIPTTLEQSVPLQNYLPKPFDSNQTSMREPFTLVNHPATLSSEIQSALLDEQVRLNYRGSAAVMQLFSADASTCKRAPL